MEQAIGCDAHKKLSVFVAVDEKGRAGEPLWVAHDPRVSGPTPDAFCRDSVPSPWDLLR